MRAYVVQILLKQRQHFLGMGARVDAGKGVGDDSRLINEVGDAAGIAGISRPVGFTQDALGIAEQGELKPGFVGKRFVGFDAIVACA